MKNKTLITIISIYLVLGGIWLFTGSQFIGWLDRQYPATDLRNLYYLKNFIFLIGTAIAAVLGVKHHYSSLLNTERKHKNELIAHEKQLNEQVILYNTVTRATNDVIWDYDIANNKLTWMSGYKEVFGYDDSKEIHSSFWSMTRVHPDDQARIIYEFEKIVKTRGTKWKAEYRYLCKDGSYKHVFDRGYLIFDDSGNPLRMLGAMQDIDARVKYEEQLLAQNEKLREIAWHNSHEVRRPLSNLIGLIPLLKDSIGDQETLTGLVNFLEISAGELDNAVLKINDQI